MAWFTLDEIPSVRFPWYGRPPLDSWIKLKQYVYERDKGVCQFPGGCGPVEYHESHCHHVWNLAKMERIIRSNLKTLCKKHHKIRHPFMLSAIEKLR